MGDDTVEVLRALWAAGAGRRPRRDLRPTKDCKNMKGVSFDGLAEPGSDLGGLAGEAGPRGQAEHRRRQHPRPRPRRADLGPASATEPPGWASHRTSRRASPS